MAPVSIPTALGWIIGTYMASNMLKDVLDIFWATPKQMDRQEKLVKLMMERKSREDANNVAGMKEAFKLWADMQREMQREGIAAQERISEREMKLGALQTMTQAALSIPTFPLMPLPYAPENIRLPEA